MRRILLSAFAVLSLLVPEAHAAGKAGLWSVTTIWQFGINKVPPALMALARQQRLKPPVNGQPFIHHICMTPSEAEDRQPLHLNSRELDCANRTVSMRRGVMVTESICHGPVEGVSRDDDDLQPQHAPLADGDRKHLPWAGGRGGSRPGHLARQHPFRRHQRFSGKIPRRSCPHEFQLYRRLGRGRLPRGAALHTPK